MRQAESPLLDVPEELAPVDGFTDAQQELLHKHWYLVNHYAGTIALKYGLSHEEAADALMDGYEGLIKAARNYDPQKAPKNATTGGNFFATTIKGHILHGARKWLGRDGNSIRRLNLSTETGTAHSLNEPVSVSSSDGVDAYLTLQEITPDSGENEDDRLIRSLDLRREISGLLSGKNQRDAEIFIRYFLLHQTRNEIATDLQVSYMTVSRTVRQVAESYSGSPVAS